MSVVKVSFPNHILRRFRFEKENLSFHELKKWIGTSYSDDVYVTYEDDEGDIVNVTNDIDLQEFLDFFKSNGKRSLRLTLLQKKQPGMPVSKQDNKKINVVKNAPQLKKKIEESVPSNEKVTVKNTKSKIQDSKRGLRAHPLEKHIKEAVRLIPVIGSQLFSTNHNRCPVRNICGTGIPRWAQKENTPVKKVQQKPTMNQDPAKIIGKRVLIKGLKNQSSVKYNRKVAEVVSYNSGKDRYTVKVLGMFNAYSGENKHISLHHQNLEPFLKLSPKESNKSANPKLQTPLITHENKKLMQCEAQQKENRKESSSGDSSTNEKHEPNATKTQSQEKVKPQQSIANTSIPKDRISRLEENDTSTLQKKINELKVQSQQRKEEKDKRILELEKEYRELLEDDEQKISELEKELKKATSLAMPKKDDKHEDGFHKKFKLIQTMGFEGSEDRLREIFHVETKKQN